MFDTVEGSDYLGDQDAIEKRIDGWGEPGASADFLSKKTLL